MVVQPKVKGFMCTTAHPEGCKESVRRQIEYVKSQPKAEGPKKVLVLGASMGYGLASRIALTYACGADSIGVIFDKPGKEKTIEKEYTLGSVGQLRTRFQAFVESIEIKKIQEGK